MNFLPHTFSCQLKTMTMKKALTHLKLNRANAGKLRKLDALAVEHQRVVQAYCDWRIARDVHEPNKCDDISEAELPTSLSGRWQRCAWRQVCGIVQSGYSNQRTNPPLLRAFCLQGSANLIVKLDEPGIRYRSVQPAYTSQECSRCGCVDENNRRSQAAFQCVNCGYAENADVNAARNIAKRFDDDELNGLPFRDVKAALEARFVRRLSSDARRVSAGRDTLRKGTAQCPQPSIRPV
jgi:hypothetical protein